MQYFPDHYVRKQINSLEVICPFAEAGCNWEGKFEEYFNHVKVCGFNIKCPLSAFGCNERARFMDKGQLDQHLQENQCGHLVMIVNRIQSMEEILKSLQNQSLASFVPLSSKQSRHQDPLPGTFHHSMLSLLQQGGEMLKSQEAEIASLKSRICNLERQIQSLTADLKRSDIRLSLIENSNHDGTMIWKITQLSQRIDDAENGKCTVTLYSLPFHSGRYGYKMCLRLDIDVKELEGTHLSLFFVVMRGEFDNILQWPFTHKVTFKLINQAGGRDIGVILQPNPLASYFLKPSSDMNIACGYPRLFSHNELDRGGFIVDDTIFIKCVIDTSTIHHP